MRSRGMLLVLVLVPAFLECGLRSLDLGANPQAALPTASDAADSDGSTSTPSTPTLEERLRARCNEPHGQRDTYLSASELTSKIAIRWYLCTPVEVSPIDKDGIELTADATWRRLVWADGGHDALVPAVTRDARGTVSCVAFADPDAGAGLDGGGKADSGTKTQTIPCDDPTARRGIFVYLEPESGSTHVLSFDLEKNPTRAFASEVGPSSETAELVPVD
jgi:hypothetical protein